MLAALALGDSLELEPAAATRVEAPGLAGGDSLVTRALGLLAARTGHRAGWRVHIDKYVPVGAGLGGGSADAAASARARQRDAARAARARRPDRARGGGGLGRPVLRLGHETALARGRGELLEPCPVRAPAWVVVAWPGVALGTAEVYARYRPPAGAGERVESLAAEPFATEDVAQLAGLIENDLGAPAAELCPPVSALRERLLASGALAACMSGSGSAVFGLFADEDGAREANERLRGALDLDRPPDANRRRR